MSGEDVPMKVTVLHETVLPGSPQGHRWHPVRSATRTDEDVKEGDTGE